LLLHFVLELKECFSLYDNNCDGMIGRQELESVMRSIGEPVTYLELDQMVKKYGNNFIKFLRSLPNTLAWGNMGFCGVEVLALFYCSVVSY